MTIGTQLRRAKLEDRYDSIIIGSGMGGLTTAAALAKAGQKVLVLERHYTAGGFTHMYERKGYAWDVGVHYIGDAHREGSTIRRIFDYVSDGQLHWAEMDPVYDRICIGSETFDYVKGEQAFRDRMIGYFPSERTAIEEYVRLIKKVTRSVSGFYLGHTLPRWLSRLLLKKLSAPFLKYADQTTDQVLRSLTRNEKLIAVLTGQWGDYGLPPKRSSFAMQAMVAKHYLEGASYPVGGAVSIARSVEAVLQRHGAQLVTSAPVESVVLEGSRAVGVRLPGNRIIRARNIISAVGVINTFQRLLPPECPAKRDLEQKLQAVSPSLAHLCLYIGLKCSHEELGVPTSNLWIYPNERHDENIARFVDQPDQSFPVVYVSFPSGKDPEWKTKHPGKSTIEIVVPAPYQWFEKWQGTAWQKRGADYVAFKQKMTERLLAILLERLPQLRDKIHYTELSSPLSTEHFSNYSRGEIYGINHDPSRFRQSWLRPDTPIKNLYLTGQDIVTCGVGGALSAGVLTAMRILGPLRSRPLMRLMRPQKRRPQ